MGWEMAIVWGGGGVKEKFLNEKSKRLFLAVAPTLPTCLLYFPPFCGFLIVSQNSLNCSKNNLKKSS